MSSANEMTGELVDGAQANASAPRRTRAELPPPDIVDLVVEAYKKHVDRTLLRENLKLTPAQRVEKFERMMKLFCELQGAASRGNPSE